MIASDENDTFICVDGKLYGDHITKVLFCKEAGKDQEIEIVADNLPLEGKEITESFQNFLLEILEPNTPQKGKREEITKYDLLIQLPVKNLAEMIHEMSKEFHSAREIEKILNMEVTENELQQINAAAQKEGHQPLSFSFKQ